MSKRKVIYLGNPLEKINKKMKLKHIIINEKAIVIVAE